MNPGSRTYWGPRLWRLLHVLAEYARDTLSWKILLQKTALLMPCEKCRTHLSQYISTHKLTDARTYIWELHNAVNMRNGLPEFAKEDLVMYSMPRQEARQAVQSLLHDITAAWSPLHHVVWNPHIYTEWKRYVAVLQNA
jgi:hypothetical protein